MLRVWLCAVGTALTGRARSMLPGVWAESGSAQQTEPKVLSSQQVPRRLGPGGSDSRTRPQAAGQPHIPSAPAPRRAGFPLPQAQKSILLSERLRQREQVQAVFWDGKGPLEPVKSQSRQPPTLPKYNADSGCRSRLPASRPLLGTRGCRSGTAGPQARAGTTSSHWSHLGSAPDHHEAFRLAVNLGTGSRGKPTMPAGAPASQVS